MSIPVNPSEPMSSSSSPLEPMFIPSEPISISGNSLEPISISLSPSFNDLLISSSSKSLISNEFISFKLIVVLKSLTTLSFTLRFLCGSTSSN